MRLPIATALGITALACLLVTVSCDRERSEVRPALQTFESFQNALFSGDQATLRRLVTRQSRPAVPQLPLVSMADKSPLLVLGAKRSDYRVHIEVSDPNEGGSRSWFVAAKEEGRWVLDLVETASLNHISVESGDLELKPRQLSPAEIERIRSMDASAIR